MLGRTIPHMIQGGNWVQGAGGGGRGAQGRMGGGLPPLVMLLAWLHGTPLPSITQAAQHSCCQRRPEGHGTGVECVEMGKKGVVLAVVAVVAMVCEMGCAQPPKSSHNPRGYIGKLRTTTEKFAQLVVRK